MDYPIFYVQVVDTQTDVNEDFPDEVVYQPLAVLFFNVGGKVSMLAELHNNVYFRAVDERVVISHDEV